MDLGLIRYELQTSYDPCYKLLSVPQLIFENTLLKEVTDNHSSAENIDVNLACSYIKPRWSRLHYGKQ
jgi:hypothetical protein